MTFAPKSTANSRFGVVAFLLSVLVSVRCSLAPAASSSLEVPARTGTSVTAFPANPILGGADPHAVLFGETFWVYPTNEGGRPTVFYAYSSADLVNWERHGPVLDFAEVSWVNSDGAPQHYAWAPCVLQRGTNFYFYYSVGPQHATPARIGVGLGTSPKGPFRDSGKPLITGGGGFEAIDPMVLRDAATGRTLLYAGGSAGATLRVYELGPDLVSLSRQIPVSTPPKFTEGAFMHLREGVYYLSYSHGGWRDASYSVHYATGSSAVGPWTYRGPILESDQRNKGPGHHSFVHDQRSGRDLIFYHRWEDQTGTGPFRGSRVLAVDTVEYDSEGLIRPIRMGRPADGRTAAGAILSPR